MMFQKTLLALMAVGASAFAPQPTAFVGRQSVSSTSLFMASEVEGKVKDIIVSQLGVDADLIMAIEEEFDCEIPEEEAANISSVQEVIDYIEKL